MGGKFLPLLPHHWSVVRACAVPIALCSHLPWPGSHCAWTTWVYCLRRDGGRRGRQCDATGTAHLSSVHMTLKASLAHVYNLSVFESNWMAHCLPTHSLPPSLCSSWTLTPAYLHQKLPVKTPPRIRAQSRCCQISSGLSMCRDLHEAYGFLCQLLYLTWVSLPCRLVF